MKKIGRGAFSFCTSLKNIDLPAGLEYIGSKCFQDSGLEEIVIPNGIVTIEFGTVASCKSLERVVFNEDSKLQKICKDSF